jgi:hypothetical protein
LTMQIADDDAKTDAALSQHFVQTVLLLSQLTDQFLSLTGNQTQLT